MKNSIATELEKVIEKDTNKFEIGNKELWDARTMVLDWIEKGLIKKKEYDIQPYAPMPDKVADDPLEAKNYML